MVRFEAFFAHRAFGARAFLMLLAAAAAAVALGVPAGQARSADSPPPAMREGGHGHWFRHVCSLPDVRFAWCGAQVVTSSDGVPLASASPPSSALTPAQFHSAYSLPATAVSGTPTIAVVDATDDPNIESDLAAFDQQFGLPACTTANGCFRKVDQNGGTSYPSGTSWHLEIALDVEMAHAICQSCKIILVEAATASMANLGKAENEAVALGANVVSNSYGGGEFSGESSYDTAYYKHPGVAITVSSGDSGYGVEYPAASQYVTAVGGTTLTLNADGTYKSEAAWSGSGSGCSAYEMKPAWQTDTGCTNRTVADVSADADPNSGAAIYDSVGATNGKAWFQVGGTSLSAPLVGAVYALTGAATTFGSAPYASPTLLNDVVAGSNGTCSTAYLCTSGAGYDGPTGLGTPHGLGAFGSSASPSPDFSLAASPSSQTVVQGAQANYPVTASPSNGFSGTVAFSVSGLPANATAGFTTTSSTSATLNVSTSGVAAGNYTLTVTGKSGNLTHSIAVSLAVQDFSLSLTPSSKTVAQGGQTTYTVSVSPLNGFSGSVSYGVSGLPSGVSGNVSNSVLTLTASATATTGSKTFTVTGTSGSDSHTATATVTVQPAASGDFSLSAAPSATVLPGGQGTVNVGITTSGGFSGGVNLGASGAPPGVSTSFSPNPATGSSSTLTLAAGSSVAAGNYQLSITGSSVTTPSLTHTISVTLVVQDFLLSITPSTQSVAAGTAATYTVAVTAANGFSGSVTLSQSGLPAAGNATFSPNPPTTSSTLTVGTSSLTPGTYPFTVTGTSNGVTRAVAGTLAVNGAGPTLSVSPTSAPRGTNVTVTWSGVANPTTTDWIGIFTPGAPNGSYLQYEYDSSCLAGWIGTAKSSGSCSFRLPRAAGQYELRLMANNGFTPIVTGVLVTAT